VVGGLDPGNDCDQPPVSEPESYCSGVCVSSPCFAPKRLDESQSHLFGSKLSGFTIEAPSFGRTLLVYFKLAQSLDCAAKDCARTRILTLRVDLQQLQELLLRVEAIMRHKEMWLT
jgi:hypothetical protein